MSSFAKVVAPAIVARCADRLKAIKSGVKIFDEPIDVAAVPAALRPLAGFDALQKFGFRLVHICGRETQLHAARPVRQRAISLRTARHSAPPATRGSRS